MDVVVLVVVVVVVVVVVGAQSLTSASVHSFGKLEGNFSSQHCCTDVNFSSH